MEESRNRDLEEERQTIIAKYDRGRGEGAEIYPWEDPAYEIYHSTDHYGYIHDTRLPLKRDTEELKREELEASRADKWIKMFKSWDKFKVQKKDPNSKLVTRTYKGIPNKVRGLFWSLFLEIPELKKAHPDTYKEMCELARKYSPDIRQIDLDINRTFRNHIMFRERYGVKQQSLFNILTAYSVYNTEIGYCQGMSQVAAFLLVYMDEEDSFWALSQLMTHPRYGMHGFFVSGFPKLIRFQTHHDKILNKLLPKLFKHFTKHGVDSNLYTLKWYFLCFLDRVPFPLALRLWDIYFLEGDRTLIVAAYMILKLHQKTLLSFKSFDDILNFLQVVLPEDFQLDIDTVITIHYHKCLEDLRKKKLDTAGEPGDDELPQLPFGFYDNIVKLLPPLEVASVDEKPMENNASPKTPPKAIQEDSKIVPEEEEEQSHSLVTNSDKFYHSSENSSLSSLLLVSQKTNVGGQQNPFETKKCVTNSSVETSKCIPNGNLTSVPSDCTSNNVFNNSNCSENISSQSAVFKSPQKKSVITITMSAVSPGRKNGQCNNNSERIRNCSNSSDGGDNNSEETVRLVVKNSDSFNDDDGNNSFYSSSGGDEKHSGLNFDRYRENDNEAYVTTIPVTPMEN